MADDYQTLTQRDEDMRKRRSEANDENNVLLQKAAQLEEDFKEAVRSGDAERIEKVKADREQNKQDIEYHRLTIQALQSERLDDPDSLRLARNVHTEAVEAMAEVAKLWDVEKAKLEKAWTALFDSITLLGAIAAKGDQYTRRRAHAIDLTGIRGLVHVQNPANRDIHMDTKRGIIYRTPEDFEAAFKQGRRS